MVDTGVWGALWVALNRPANLGDGFTSAAWEVSTGGGMDMPARGRPHAMQIVFRLVDAVSEGVDEMRNKGHVLEVVCAASWRTTPVVGC